MVAQQGHADSGAAGDIRSAKFLLACENLDQAKPVGIGKRGKDLRSRLDVDSLHVQECTLLIYSNNHLTI